MVRRRILSGLCVLLLLALCAVPAFAAQQRVYDLSGLFTADEAADLETRIDGLRSSLGVDIVILTSDDAEGKESIAYADDFWDENGFGAGDDNTGILFFIDMDNRVPTVSTCGRMIDVLNDSRKTELLDGVWQYLADGDYAGAANAFLDGTEQYVGEGIEEGQYRYDSETGEILTAPHKVLTFGEVIFALIPGALIALIIQASVKAKYRLKGSTYSYDVSGNSAVKTTGATDNYIRTAVIRTPKAPPPSSGGSSGGGLGSSVHTSSGGVSHGGGSGRKF